MGDDAKCFYRVAGCEVRVASCIGKTRNPQPATRNPHPITTILLAVLPSFRQAKISDPL